MTETFPTTYCDILNLTNTNIKAILMNEKYSDQAELASYKKKE